MATTTKKAAKVIDAKVLTIDELRAQLAGKQNDLIETKKGHRLGELTNPHVLTVSRKEIARLHTAIRAAQIAKAACPPKLSDETLLGVSKSNLKKVLEEE